MARPPRIEFPAAFYHVIIRGNQRQDIFVDDEDRREFLSRVKHYKGKCGFVLYAYVLMTNHVHLLLETPGSPLSKIMQLINFTYTRYFNKKYGKVGHLFQGRYKSILCDCDEYLLGLVRYIHLNPVRARIVDNPEEYQCSSHRDYSEKNSGNIETDRVLRLFSESVMQARNLYKEFVDGAIGMGSDASFYRTVGQQVLGDEEFVEKVEKEIGTIHRPTRKPSLQAMFKAVEELTGIGRQAIVSRKRDKEVIFARRLLVGACREAGYQMVDLQPVLRRDLSVLSRLSQVAEGSQEQNTMKRLLKKLYA